MKINKCKTSSSRGLSDQPLALGRVFVVVVAVVSVVAFLTGRSVPCDESGAVSGETDSSEAGSFLLGEVFPFNLSADEKDNENTNVEDSVREKGKNS